MGQFIGKSKKRGHMYLLYMCIMALFLGAASNAHAVGEASTKFNFYVPPNNENVGRYVALVVTAVTGMAGETTTVQIVDDGADGDTDDSVSNISLTRGQSYILYIKDGAVNDDAGGKADGDYFKISSTRPVVVQMSTQSNWQHDWAPASNKKMLGREFYLYSPPSSGADSDINVFAYSNNTKVVIYDITSTPKTTTGTTTVSFTSPTKILERTLNEGEDLIHRNSNISANLLQIGRTYYIQATNPVTVIYGHLAGLVANENSPRDGGGFVPSSNGSSVGELFYFSIPHNPGLESEKELRIVSYDDANAATLYGWDSATSGWITIGTTTLQANGHGDFVGATNATFKQYGLYKLVGTTGKRLAVFEANWLETGAVGTSDIASSVSSSDGSGAGKLFMVYMGPPGYQTSTTQNGTYSHLFIFGHQAGTTVTVKDSDTNGTYFSTTCNLGVDEYCDVKLDQTQWNNLNTAGRRPYLTVTSSHPVAVLSTNWNDNWMTYATSVLIPSPEVALSGNTTVNCGSQATYTFTTQNTTGGTFTTTSTSITLPAGLSYVSTSGDLGTTPTTTTNNGITKLTFSGYAHSDTTVLTQTVVVNATCLDAGGALLPSGSVVTLSTTSGGTYIGDNYMSQESLPIQLIGNNALSSISASGTGSQINVAWTTSKEASNTGFAILRSTSLTGTYTQINGTLVASQGDSIVGHSYTYNDTTAQANTLYYYKVELRPSTGSAIQIGPVTATSVDKTAPDAPTIVATGGNGQISLAISGGNNDGDLDGYKIYRSSNQSGPFTLLTNSLVGPSYVDTSVINGFTYYYRALAFDTAGNISDLSNTDDATPTVPANSSTYIVAFEDMRGAGNNDWDYNDFVSRIYSSFTVNGSNQVTKITIHIEALSRGAGYVHEFWMRVPNLVGGSSYTLAMYDRPGGTLLSSSGGSQTDAVSVKIWNNTKDALPAYTAGTHGFATNTSFDQPSHTQGQAAILTITLATPSSNPLSGMANAPFDPHIILPYITGRPEIHRVPYCTTCQETVDTAVYSNASLFGSNLEFVLVVPENNTNFWRWPEEVVPIWDAYTSYDNYILSGKTTNTDWYLTPDNATTWQHYSSTP